MNTLFAGEVIVRTSSLEYLQLALGIRNVAASSNHFYVTVFSKAWRDAYEQNTHADFTVKLAQLVDLSTTSNWEVGVCESSCSAPHTGENPTLIYSNLISPHFVGYSIVRFMRTFVFPSAAFCQQEFRNEH